jgi:hypothetical protein
MKKFLVAFLLIPSLAFGAASYPNSLKSFSTKVDNVDDVMAEDINGLQDEVVAIETALGVGKSTSVIQVVNVQSGAVATGTTAQISEGDQYLTLAITPKSATNTLKIDVVWNGTNASSTVPVVALFQDNTAGALAAVTSVTSAGDVRTMAFTHNMVSGTTSETTFKVRAGAASGTTTFNGFGGARKLGGVIASSITITELKA